MPTAASGPARRQGPAGGRVALVLCATKENTNCFREKEGKKGRASAGQRRPPAPHSPPPITERGAAESVPDPTAPRHPPTAPQRRHLASRSLLRAPPHPARPLAVRRRYFRREAPWHVPRRKRSVGRVARRRAGRSSEQWRPPGSGCVPT